MNAETMALLVSKGLSAEDLLEVARAMELDKTRSSAAVRQKRYRENKRNERDVTRDVTPPPNEYISNPQPVSDETVLATQPKANGRGTRLAVDFEAPNDWIAWAVKKRGWSRTDAIEEAECFARYWQAKPGREACKLDWPKTWQNWVVNSNRKPSAQGPPGSFLEQYSKEVERKAAQAH